MKVKFHLPDFAVHYRTNLIFLTMLENCPHYFRDGLEIASIYGVFPPSLWNGGRTQGGDCTDDFIKIVTNTFNKKNIPLRFTFTNPVLEEKHLSDPFCNKVMDIANNGMNGVIVNSPLLEKYLREKYPNFKYTSSTCKRLNDGKALAEELKKNYDIVVVDYDLNHEYDVLETLPNKDKCEFLVNAVCNPNCKLRSEHYKVIGQQQIAYCEFKKKHPSQDFDVHQYPELVESEATKCRCVDRNIFDVKKLKNTITPEEIWEKLVPMGFSQFKIEGRTASRLNLIETYIYYMIKPEYADEARFMLLYNLENNNVIRINRDYE